MILFGSPRTREAAPINCNGAEAGLRVAPNLDETYETFARRTRPHARTSAVQTPLLDPRRLSARQSSIEGPQYSGISACVVLSAGAWTTRSDFEAFLGPSYSP